MGSIILNVAVFEDFPIKILARTNFLVFKGNTEFLLHKICENTKFSLPRLLPYKDRIADSVLIRQNTGQ